MQKALLQRHLQLSQVLRDVPGTTGQRIVRAIVAGARAPMTLAALRNSRGQKEAAEIALALTGTWREEPLFVLTQALALVACYTTQLRACDAHMERLFSVLQPRCEPAPQESIPSEAAPPPRRKPHAPSKNAPDGNTRAHRLRLTGVDLGAVHGISASMAQTLVAESGTDMRKWLDEKHCCSWLGLAPKQAISGGKVRKSRTMKNRHRAAQAFRMAAQSVLRAHCALGACYRRLQGRLGPAQALVATAHKMARTV